MRKQCCGQNKDGTRCRLPINKESFGFACKKHWRMVPWATREDYRDALDDIHFAITGNLSLRLRRRGSGEISFFTAKEVPHDKRQNRGGSKAGNAAASR